LNGHLQVLQWLRAQTPPCPWNESACAAAAQGGHFEVLQWLNMQGCSWDYETFHSAVTYGRFKMMSWLLLHEASPADALQTRACQTAVLKNRLDVLQWLKLRGYPWDIDEVCFRCIQRGQWPMLRWVLTKETPPKGLKMRPPAFDRESALIHVNVIETIQFPNQYYEDFAWVQKHHNLNVPSLRRWSDAVQEVSRDVLEVTLCHDLTTLVKSYC